MPKTILITGASSGIGAACARQAVEAGHQVALVARSGDRLSDMVKEFGRDNAIALTCDVTNPDAQKEVFEKAVERYPALDVVFANAGVGASAKGTEGGDIDNFRDMIMVNVFAMTVTAKLALPHLKASGGHLVLTGSRAAHNSIPGSVYGATKWFVRGYADNLAAEVDGTGARVTCIHPGMVDTPFFDEEKPEALRPEDVARAFIYAIEQPRRVQVPSLQIYPVSI